MANGFTSTYSREIPILSMLQHRFLCVARPGCRKCATALYNEAVRLLPLERETSCAPSRNAATFQVEGYLSLLISLGSTLYFLELLVSARLEILKCSRSPPIGSPPASQPQTVGIAPHDVEARR